MNNSIKNTHKHVYPAKEKYMKEYIGKAKKPKGYSVCSDCSLRMFICM